MGGTQRPWLGVPQAGMEAWRMMEPGAVIFMKMGARPSAEAPEGLARTITAG